MCYRGFWLCFSAFIILNILLYFFIFLFNSKIPFSKFDYIVNSHHYFADPRIKGGKFDFLTALGQYDAQWYLKIGNKGYPKSPYGTDVNKKNVLNGLAYAFFPLYPLILAFVNFPIRNIELCAFIISNILMGANFVSLYIVLGSLYSSNKALKTIFLLFFFPFAIFYRSYFTEGLFLLLLVWFSYFLIRRRWLWSAFFLSLLFVTRPNGLFLAPLFLFYIGRAFSRREISLREFVIPLVISVLPFIGWLAYCWVNTGSPIYWLTIQSSWYSSKGFSFPLFQNIATIFKFFSLPWHSFHVSRIDVLTIIFAGILLFVSRKKLRPELWRMSLLLWIVPLVTRDTMSFTRYQIVLFPLFLYLAQKLRGGGYIFLLSVFCLGLFLLSIYFVNWYWVG